jgi:DNA-binding transcriptional ArsR family regulator
MFLASIVLDIRTIELGATGRYDAVMRPLFHPALEDITVEAILHALSDPVRVAIYAEIAGSDCAHNCSNFLNVSEKAIPKSTLSQHFKILREAGLIRGERCGVEMRNASRCAEIDKRFPGLLGAIVKAHNVQCGVKSRTGQRRRKPDRRGAKRK